MPQSSSVHSKWLRLATTLPVVFVYGLWTAPLSAAPAVADAPVAVQPVAPVTPEFTVTESRLLDEITAASFQYFWKEANPTTGLIPDKISLRNTCSAAAMGFGFAALPVGVERGYITREQGAARALLALRTLETTSA